MWRGEGENLFLFKVFCEVLRFSLLSLLFLILLVEFSEEIIVNIVVKILEVLIFEVLNLELDYFLKVDRFWLSILVNYMLNIFY